LKTGLPEIQTGVKGSLEGSHLRFREGETIGELQRGLSAGTLSSSSQKLKRKKTEIAEGIRGKSRAMARATMPMSGVLLNILEAKIPGPLRITESFPLRETCCLGGFENKSGPFDGKVAGKEF